MVRPMSFSDRQHFIQTLAVCRNLSITCGQGEHRDSALQMRCKKLIDAIDGVAGELVGDANYFKVIDLQPRIKDEEALVRKK
jgi:hypothetical protein